MYLYNVCFSILNINRIMSSRLTFKRPSKKNRQANNKGAYKSVFLPPDSESTTEKDSSEVSDNSAKFNHESRKFNHPESRKFSHPESHKFNPERGFYMDEKSELDLNLTFVDVSDFGQESPPLLGRKSSESSTFLDDAASFDDPEEGDMFLLNTFCKQDFVGKNCFRYQSQQDRDDSCLEYSKDNFFRCYEDSGLGLSLSNPKLFPNQND